MNTALATRQGNGHAAPISSGELMESVIIKGDLSKLTPAERGSYYMKVCESVGLNPLTKPFEYIVLNGKLTLYALRACTDQLRSVHKVSVEELAETERDGVYVVTAKVRNAEGRTDMAKGAVMIANLKGEALANAFMKAETKAKRRATLSICGLGFLDETEIETIPGARQPPRPEPVRLASPTIQAEPPHNPTTGEIIEDIPAEIDRRHKPGPHKLDVPRGGDGTPNWIAFGGAFIAATNEAKSQAEVAEWIKENQESIDVMKQAANRVYKRMDAAVSKHLAMLVPSDDVLGQSDMDEPGNLLAAG